MWFDCDSVKNPETGRRSWTIWMKGKSESESCSVMSDSLWPHGLYSPWNSLGQNTGVGSLSLLQGIFPTQGSNPGLPNCRQILYQLNHKGSTRILEWVAYPVSSGSSWPRNWTGVSCIAGRFITNWITREALGLSGWAHVITRLFIRGKEGPESQKEMCGQKRNLKWCGHEPRNVGSLQMPKRQGWVLP